MKTMCKFAVYNRDGKTRTTYRIVRYEDGSFFIQEYLSGARQWCNVYKPFVHWSLFKELWNSVEFKCLFGVTIK